MAQVVKCLMYKHKNLSLDLQNLHKNLGLGAPIFEPCAGSKGMEIGMSKEFSVWPVLASWWALGSVGYLFQKEKVRIIKSLSIAFWVSHPDKHTFICAHHMHITNIKKEWEKGRNRTLGPSSFPLKHAETFPGPQLHSRAFPLLTTGPHLLSFDYHLVALILSHRWACLALPHCSVHDTELWLLLANS